MIGFLKCLSILFSIHTFCSKLSAFQNNHIHVQKKHWLMPSKVMTQQTGWNEGQQFNYPDAA